MDSIKLHPYEVKVLISSWRNEPKYIEFIDSCESQIKDLRSINKIDSIELRACNELKNAQGLLIDAHVNETTDLKSDLKRETFWRIFWKTCTGVISIVSGTIIIYEEIKP